MKPRRLLQRIEQGNSANIDFADLLGLVEAFGFQWVGGKGSHRRYNRSDIAEGLDFQEDHGQAKPYQVKQLRNMIREHGLRLED